MCAPTRLENDDLAPELERFKYTAAIFTFLMIACSPPGVDASRAPEASTPDSQEEMRTSVRYAYERFWTRLHEVGSQADPEWRSRLTEVAADPQLSAPVHELRTIRGRSINSDGNVISRIGEIEASGNRAALWDCQSNQADGVARNSVVANLVYGEDAMWRVSKITYQEGAC